MKQVNDLDVTFTSEKEDSLRKQKSISICIKTLFKHSPTIFK